MSTTQHFLECIKLSQHDSFYIWIVKRTFGCLCLLFPLGLSSSVVTFKQFMLKPKSLYLLEVSASEFSILFWKFIMRFLLQMKIKWINNALNMCISFVQMLFAFFSLLFFSPCQVLRSGYKGKASCFSTHKLFRREWAAKCSPTQALKSTLISASSAPLEKRSTFFHSFQHIHILHF